MWTKTKMLLLGIFSSHFTSPAAAGKNGEAVCDYDKYRHDGRGRDATKKLLLSPSHHSGGSGGGVGGGSTAMIQPPINDIYLCDKCENEFYSLKEVQAHERQCCGEVPPSPPTPSPEPDAHEEEPEAAGQVPFLAYFNLQPAQHTGLQPYSSPRKKSVSGPPAKLPGPIYPRYDTIALASPLGRYLFTHSKFRNKYQASQHAVMRYERHLHATPNAEVNFRERYTSRWLVVWRGRKEQQAWVHLYSFSRAQRKERMITIRTGLDKESRRLLRLCRPVLVRVKKLPKRTVDRLKRLGDPTSAPCIDLTDEHHLEGGQLLTRPFDPRQSYWPGCGNPAGQQVNVQLQWVPGLPPEVTNACLPGSSGFSSQATAQVGLTGLNMGHHSSLSFIPFMPDNTQQQQQRMPGLTTLQMSSQALVTNNSHFKNHQHSLGQQGGAGTSPDFSLPAGLSVIPLGPTVQPTLSQLQADRMKPRSKKKFPSHDLLENNLLQPNRQQPNKQQQHQQNVGQMPFAFPSQQPQALEWEKVVPAAGSDGGGLSHTLTSSSIEIIELSSDEDEYGHGVQGRTEAANAPQQLDGLACYPHTGAKVPSESSEYYSLSKNGNSHWSSQQKSHCGAGRVGDLATNGQPPNVLPSTPKPHPAPCLLGPHVKGNSRKRKGEEDLAAAPWGKTIIMDISTQGGVTISEESSPFILESSALGLPLPQETPWQAPQGVPVPSSPFPSNTHSSADTTHASESSNSMVVDEEISFKTPIQIDEDISFNIHQVGPQESGHLTPRKTSGSPLDKSTQEGSLSTAFFSNLVNKGVELVKSLMAIKDDSPPPTVTPPRSAARESQHRAQECGSTVITAATGTGSPKRTSEIQKLLQDECRELRRGGLGELREASHLESEGIKLTRRAAGRFLPRQHCRRHHNARRSENLPPHHRAKRRGERRASLGHGTLGLKAAATLSIDENGNSAAYVEASPNKQQQQQQTAREYHCPPCGSVHANGHANGQQKLSNSSVLSKSTVFSDISLRLCDVSDNTCCNSKWKTDSGSTVAGKVECRVSGPDMKATESYKAGEGERNSLTCGDKVTLEQVKDQTQCSDKAPAVGRGKAGATLNLPWDSSPTKRLDELHGPGKNVLLAHGQTHPLGHTELTGETAEECGAQLAQCPPPNRQELPVAGSSTPAHTSSPSKSPLTLLNFRKAQPSPTLGQHGGIGSPQKLKSQPFLCPLAKPHSTKRKRRKAPLCRELSGLSCDEWKEIRGTGFHPSDLVGCEGVKYLGVSSDEEEPLPAAAALQGNEAKEQEARKPKVSRELARLLKDECKELRRRPGRPPKTHRDRDRAKRVSAVHPLAGLAGQHQEDLDALGTGGSAGGPGGGRCNTRSQVNTLPLVEVFTPRDSHRHLLRSEVAMCVVNYMLPNIH